MLDGEPDAVDGNTRLVRHLEFHWRGPGVRASLNQFKDLFSKFAFHKFPAIPTAADWHRPQPEFYGKRRLAPKTHSMIYNVGRPDRAHRSLTDLYGAQNATFCAWAWGTEAERDSIRFCSLRTEPWPVANIVGLTGA